VPGHWPLALHRSGSRRRSFLRSHDNQRASREQRCLDRQQHRVSMARKQAIVGAASRRASTTG
jgi:hypothetical protein